jgi:uncharacterized protein YkwD
MDRRIFLFAASGVLTASAATPMSAQAQAEGSDESVVLDGIIDYFDTLSGSLEDAGGGLYQASTEDGLLTEHNRFRAAHGLTPLARDAAFDSAARAHAADMLRRDYFEHASPEGYTSEQRVALLARRFVGAAGENIAMQDGGAASPTAGDLGKMWRDSPGHRANMLRPQFTHVGFGVVGRGGRTIAAVVFGQRFAALAQPVPFRISGGDALLGVLEGATPALLAYELQPVQGGHSLGPFADRDAPGALAPGAYAIRPHAPDPAVPNRYWILFGPIVMAG